MADQTPPPGDPTCVFCKIAAGQISCRKVYEDAHVLAFLDIGPIVHGHTLVIPKTHVANLLDCPPEIAAHLARVLPGLCRAVLSVTGAPACHVLTNNGADAMQSVFHLHHHILPRKADDGFSIPWRPGNLNAEQAAAMADGIRRQLAGP